MDLHRTTGKPDWETVKPANRNVFQTIAASTHSIITPANLITLIGLGIVLYGLWALIAHHYWLGLSMLIIGRLLDVADGVVASKTGTKSPTGEFFDAVADKIGTFLTVIVLVIAQVADWWVIGALILPQILIPLVVLYKKQKRINVHPTRQGKLSMAALWVGVPGLIILKALGNPVLLTFVIYAVIIASIVLGFYALWQYATGREQEV